jgi:hypothetical protein
MLSNTDFPVLSLPKYRDVKASDLPLLSKILIKTSNFQPY